jgi:hypothetical protein
MSQEGVRDPEDGTSADVIQVEKAALDATAEKKRIEAISLELQLKKIEEANAGSKDWQALPDQIIADGGPLLHFDHLFTFPCSNGIYLCLPEQIAGYSTTEIGPLPTNLGGNWISNWTFSGSVSRLIFY